MCLKDHNDDVDGDFIVGISGYLANLQVKESPEGESKVCFISGDHDCLSIGEIIKAAGYNPNSLLSRKLLIIIKDYY